MPPLRHPFSRTPTRPVRTRSVVATVALLAAGTVAPVMAPAVQADDPNLPVPGPASESPTRQTPAEQRPRSFSFKLATFNVLGSQHTRGSSRYAPGGHRAAITADLIKDRRIDLIGMQEVQVDQFRVLRDRLPGYRIWPGTRLDNQGIRLQIAFRRTVFELADTGTITTRFDRQSRPIPWVKLRNRHTGRLLYMVDIHNSPRGQEAERDSATRAEIRLVQRLRRSHKPVFVGGDMNEKEEWFCRVVGNTDLHAANGGSASSRGCRPPARQLRIDWLMGGRRIDFSHYREDHGPRVRSASDHELIHARVSVKPPR
jgi:endonuclease/exonuclease/phosphatase family metal-dependent hydrolase